MNAVFLIQRRQLIIGNVLSSKKLSSHTVLHSKTIPTATEIREPGSARWNKKNIQMLFPKQHLQIFPSRMPTGATGEDDAMRLQPLCDNQHLEKIDKSDIETLPEVDIQLPSLRGTNIEEHFHMIAEEQSAPYREAIERLPAKVPPIPKVWTKSPGWHRYDLSTDTPEPVSYPDDDALIFDVEVCVSAGHAPVMAMALGTTGRWYSWISTLLASDALHADPDRRYQPQDLIPLECDPTEAGSEKQYQRKRIVIGHNVSYDRARVREQYWLQPTCLRFLDTMSLHVCVSGVTSYQRAMLKSNKEPPPEDEAWRERSALNNLADVYALYCGGQLPKGKRETFIEGTLQDVRADFNSLMTYCAMDVQATCNVLQQLWPLFRERFPHPATLAGMLEMGSAYLPVNGNWQRYLTETDLAYEDMDLEAKHLLAQRADAACSLLHDAEYRKNLWVWDLDWTVQELKLKAPVRQKRQKKDTVTEKVGDSEPNDEQTEAERLARKFAPLYATADRLPVRRPLLPGYPAWYRNLCSKPPDEGPWRPGPSEKLSTGMQIAPKLLSLSWEGYPLHYMRGHGWGFLVPFRYTRPADHDPNECALPLEQLAAACPVVDFAGRTGASRDESTEALYELSANVERTISRKDYYRKPAKPGQTAYAGSGVWCNVELEGCCYFLQLPHKDGAGHRVGNPLSKDFLAKFSENVLAGDGRAAQRVVEIARALSYWRNNRDRIRGQLVVWHQPDVGAIVPQVVVCGTLTRRAMEPTWMTASNAQRERIGSELRAMVQAPPGYRFVGADVDSQELWIASLLGDADAGGQHGATPFGWMTLSGTKAAGTDMHSVTANAVGISRDHAKVLNYARIYGAGPQFAERLLKQFNPTLTVAEARSKASKMFALTKGRRVYRLRPEYRAELPTQPEHSTAYEALALARHQNRAVSELFERPRWHGGTESAMFNRLEEIAASDAPVTPFLGGRLSRALEPHPGMEDRFLPTRVNWVVQSGAVDFLHLMLVCMRWLVDGAGLRFCLSFHDEVRYLVPERYAYHAALAMHVTNLLTRSFCAHRVGIRDLPQSVAFFSKVEVDRVLRKEAQHDCRTPSNPHGLRVGYGIPDGESLDVQQTLAKLGPSESDLSRWEWHRPKDAGQNRPKSGRPTGKASRKTKL